MKHCKEHDIPYDEMGYCAVGCSGWAEGDGGMNKINPDELSQPMGCFKCKHIHSKDITCLEYQQAIVNHHKAVITELEKELTEAREQNTRDVQTATKQLEQTGMELAELEKEVEAIRSTYCVEHGGSPGSEKDCVRCLKAALEKIDKTSLGCKCGEVAKKALKGKTQET